MDARTPDLDLTPASAPKVPLVVLAMLISTFMAAAEVTIISTAMPTIVTRLGGFHLFTWAFGIYLVGQAVMTPVYGRLADLYGRRVVYLGSTGLFLAGSLLCGLAWSMPALIVFRAVQGLGGAGLVPLATTIISDVSPEAERPRLLGYVSGVWGLAAIAGPLLGSLCVSTLGWPFVFWINLPFGLVTMAMVARHVRDPVRRVRPGAGGVGPGRVGLLTGGIVCGMAALIQGQSLPAAWLGGLCGVSVACLAWFAVCERRAAQPLLAGALLRRPVVLAANLSALLGGGLLIAFTAFLPAWVQGVMGEPALASGLVLGVMTVSWSACSLGLGRVLVRYPIRTVALSASGLLVVGSAGLMILGADWPALLAASAALGAGLGASSLVFMVAIQSAVAWEDRGRATALFYFCRLAGQALGAAAFGGVLNYGLAGGGPGTRDALRALMDPAARLAMPLAEFGRLHMGLAAALHLVFVAVLVTAGLTLPVALIAPRRRPA